MTRVHLDAFFKFHRIHLRPTEVKGNRITVAPEKVLEILGRRLDKTSAAAWDRPVIAFEIRGIAEAFGIKVPAPVNRVVREGDLAAIAGDQANLRRIQRSREDRNSFSQSLQNVPLKALLDYGAMAQGKTIDWEQGFEPDFVLKSILPHLSPAAKQGLLNGFDENEVPQMFLALDNAGRLELYRFLQIGMPSRHGQEKLLLRVPHSLFDNGFLRGLTTNELLGFAIAMRKVDRSYFEQNIMPLITTT